MFTRKSFIFSLLIIVCTIALLLSLGRLPFCKCDKIALWSGDINGPENSQQIVDPYSFTHVIHGLAFYGALHLIAPQVALPARLLIAVGVESGWEVLENTNFTIDRYREDTVSYGYYGDSILNSISDIIMMVIGFYLAAKLKPWHTVALIVLIEIILALTIRDGLLINIIMLIWPLEWLKNWQLGT